MSQALELLQAAASDGDGYVALQDTPYRTHHLLAEAALRHTGPTSKVFEGGVSSGYFARVLASAGRQVDGLEVDPVAAEKARAVCGKVFVGDLQEFDFSALDDYDLVLFGDTLEHVTDPQAVLRAVRSHIRPGGALVVSVPNIANWAIRLSLLAGRFRYADRGILDRSHLRFYTRSTLVELVAGAGYEVREVVGSVPVPLVRSAALCRLAFRFGNLRPSLFAYAFVVTATPRA